MKGTLLKCLCCGRETLAVGFPQRQCIAIRDRRHGTTHVTALSLGEIVGMLDPLGTAYQSVNGSGSEGES